MEFQFLLLWSWAGGTHATLTQEKKWRVNFLTTLLPPGSTEELLPLFPGSSWCLLGQAPIFQSEYSHACSASHKTSQFEAQQQQSLSQHWLQEPIKRETGDFRFSQKICRQAEAF